MRGIELTDLTRAEREAVHWRLFAGELAADAVRDLDSVQKVIEDERFQLTEPSKYALKQRAGRRLTERDEALRRAKATKAHVRELLWPPDEEVAHA